MLGAVVVLLALLVGGLTQVPRQSQGYDTDSNRTLAAQGSVVAEESNATGTSVADLMNGLQTQNRLGLQVELDGVVTQSAAESTRAASAAQATPLGSVGADFAAVFADRAEAARNLRSAVDGYLGMQPLPVAGAAATAASTSGGQATLLSGTQATNRIAAVGALLAHSDSLYRSVRHTLATAAGHGRLPTSAWVRNSEQWGLGTVATQVDLMATSPSLAASHYLALRTVQITPPALPTPQGGSSSVSVISPTTQISVDVVLGNNGTVDEPRATVHLTIANQASGATSTRTDTVALASAASRALPTTNFHVTPGQTYVLTISVVLPAGQTQTVDTSVQDVLQVALATCAGPKGQLSTTCTSRP
ncbi:MAG TPA: hypothetical protein VG346_11475 [Acidimicrobiales bacterium]|nr:hypothetical protein [Acidimicrobiales bacterium]